MDGYESYLQCSECGNTFPVILTPEGPCDDCGGELVVKHAGDPTESGHGRRVQPFFRRPEEPRPRHHHGRVSPVSVVIHDQPFPPGAPGFGFAGSAAAAAAAMLERRQRA